MSYIGIDLGNKKVGLAISIEGIAIPKNIVSRTKLIEILKKMKSKYGTHTFIVGLPYDLFGVQTTQLEKTQKFIEKLKNIFSSDTVIGFDERFSTLEARRDNNSEEVDDVSASLILQGYLESIK